jgi:hypothetical protein
MNLSNQALGAIMMALQKSLMEQSDIVPVLQGFVLTETDEGLVIENPPIIEVNIEDGEDDDATEEIQKEDA